MRLIVFVMLSTFGWVKDDLIVLKSSANLVINITCMFLYLSKALQLFEKLSIQGLFLGELIQGLISPAGD
jgi:hypothetical protein